MPVSGARLERMRATLKRESEVLAALAEALDDNSAAAVDLLLQTTGHVLVGGAGTSNAVAKRFAHLLSCSGQPAIFLHPADSLHGSSGAVTPNDTVILISKGGKTAEVNNFARIVKSRGAKLIAFTEAPDSELGRLADAIVKVKIPADSDPFGMVATSSSLANAAVADAICETILVEKGYTKEAFATTHPGGAVGERLASEVGQTSVCGGLQSAAIRKMMTAVLFQGREQMSISQIDVPTPGPGEVLLQIAACGICGGDARSYFQGDANTGTLRIPGHEMTGIVVDTGGPAPYKPGDRLALAADVHCGHCWFCRHELFNVCDHHRVLGKHMNGGLADYMLLTRDILEHGIINRVPDGMPFLHAALSEPLCSILASHDELRIQSGETVAVVGSGPMGVMHSELLRARGARVLLIDLTEARLQRAREDFGIEHTIAAREHDPIDAVKSLTEGRGADVVICAAPSAAVVTQSPWLVRKRGRIGLFGGLPAAQKDAPLDINRIHYGEIQLIGNFSYHPRYHRKSLELLATGAIRADKLITRYDITETERGLHDIKNGNVLKAVVVPNKGELVC